MTPPCVKDCPERSPTCHTSCRRYKAYQESMRQEREARWEKAEIDRACLDGKKRKRQYMPQV